MAPCFLVCVIGSDCSLFRDLPYNYRALGQGPFLISSLLSARIWQAVFLYRQAPSAAEPQVFSRLMGSRTSSRHSAFALKGIRGYR